MKPGTIWKIIRHLEGLVEALKAELK